MDRGLPHRWALGDGEEGQQEEEELSLEPTVGDTGEYHYQPSAILTTQNPQLQLKRPKP